MWSAFRQSVAKTEAQKSINCPFQTPMRRILQFSLSFLTVDRIPKTPEKWGKTPNMSPVSPVFSYSYSIGMYIENLPVAL